ncbi:antirestriction protein [Escherichia coli]
MSAENQTYIKPVATAFGTTKEEFYSWLFGDYALKASVMTHRLMQVMCKEYCGDVTWQGYMVFEDCGFIFPKCDQSFKLEWPLNYYSGRVSPQAAGIIVTIFVMQHCFETAVEYAHNEFACRMMEAMDKLKDYAGTLPEREEIFKAIN